jgi:hypothetical protein
MTGQNAIDMGALLAIMTGAHEKESHEERPCWPGRLEIMAFVAHVYGLRPQDMDKVADRLEAHLAVCQCPPRSSPPEGW